MTIQEIINILQKIALTQPNVSSVGEGDIYDTLNAEASTRYAYFFITQNRHQQTEDTDRYSLNIFYIDRLTDDKSNKLQIQSIGKEVLGNVFNTFCEDFDIEVPTIEYQVFTERFSDYCAGVYATVAFEVMREGSCTDYYDGKYEHLIPVKIINQTKQVKFTANGMYDVTYDRDYTGLENVEVEVDVDVTQYIEQGRQEGYNDGYAQGETEGYGQGYANGYSEGETKGYDNGYSNGYSEGETEGINQGIEQGINQGIEQGREQVRNEAEDLYLTENGVYEGDNLYKRVEVAVDVEEQYNKGYEDGSNAASADAVVLDVTSNGTIYTKFADFDFPEPLTGDDFYSYMTVEGENTIGSFTTKYEGNTNTVVELWFRHRGDNTGDRSIIQKFSYSNSYGLQIDGETGRLILNNITYTFPLPANVFNKIRFSTSGVWVNDVQVCEIADEYTSTGTNWNIGGNVGPEGYPAWGDYGMVKIDDNVYIPTVNGYLNTATGEILQKGSPYYKLNFTFTEISKPQVLDNLIKRVNVNVPLSIIQGDGLLKFAYSTFTKAPEFVLNGVTDLTYQFQYCSSLKDVSFLGTLDMNGVTTIQRMFENCRALVDCSPLRNWDVSTIKSMEGIFYYCDKILDFSFMETWVTTNLQDAKYLFYRCVAGNNIPALNASSFTTNQWFGSTDLTALTNFGGFIGLKYYDTTNYGFYRTPNLTYESWLNVIDGLYDFTGNGETPSSTQGKLKLHSNAYNLLTTDDIARATAKGWTLS